MQQPITGLTPGPRNSGRASECLSHHRRLAPLPKPASAQPNHRLPQRSPGGLAPWTSAWFPTCKWLLTMASRTSPSAFSSRGKFFVRKLL